MRDDGLEMECVRDYSYTTILCLIRKHVYPGITASLGDCGCTRTVVFLYLEMVNLAALQPCNSSCICLADMKRNNISGVYICHYLIRIQRQGITF
jgi:hypothetical protein